MTIEKVKNTGNMAYAFSNNKSEYEVDRNSWFTPVYYVELVREVLGSIDLDPFSSDHSNQYVNATVYYTEEDDALSIDWVTGNIFMNPPYSRSLLGKSVKKFLEQRDKNAEHIVLINNTTETQYYQSLLKECSAICLPNHRISFDSYDDKAVSKNNRGQTFFYFGKDIDKFYNSFNQVGTILKTL